MIEDLKKLLESKQIDKPKYAIIGVDPAITCTGLSILIVDKKGSYHFGGGKEFKSKVKAKEPSNTVRLTELHVDLYNDIKQIKEILTKHNIELVGAGLEIPAVFLKKNNFSRDLIQREACCVGRVALGRNDIYIFGDKDDKPVRPIQLFALSGASKKGIGAGLNDKDKKYLKKTMTKTWLEENCKIWYSLGNGFEISDALAVAVVAWRKEFVKLVK